MHWPPSAEKTSDKQRIRRNEIRAVKINAQDHIVLFSTPLKEIPDIVAKLSMEQRSRQLALVIQSITTAYGIQPPTTSQGDVPLPPSRSGAEVGAKRRKLSKGASPL